MPSVIGQEHSKVHIPEKQGFDELKSCNFGNFCNILYFMEYNFQITECYDDHKCKPKNEMLII